MWFESSHLWCLQQRYLTHSTRINTRDTHLSCTLFWNHASDVNRVVLNLADFCSYNQICNIFYLRTILCKVFHCPWTYFLLCMIKPKFIIFGQPKLRFILYVSCIYDKKFILYRLHCSSFSFFLSCSAASFWSEMR